MSDTMDVNTFNLMDEHEMFAFANFMANAKIDKQANCKSSEKQSMVELADLFAADELPEEIYPLNFKIIHKEQVCDSKLIDYAAKRPDYTLEVFHGGRKSRQLICKNGKIVIPRSLQQRVVDWYHTMLCHPGATRLEDTIRQHFVWSALREDVRNACKKCHTCQVTKRTTAKFGHLPVKENNLKPWETLCVDLIGPYKIPRKGKTTRSKEEDCLTLWCVTMKVPATGWFKMAEIKTKSADVIANVIEQTWFNRYPWPTEVVLDRRTEFMAEFTEMIQRDYGVTKHLINA
jgi:hypothetical protein